MKNSSAGHDDFDAKSVKFVAVELLEPLIHICNLSLSRGEFPDDMKIARVVPIHKKAVETNLAITGRFQFYPFSLNCSKDLCMTELSILMIIFQYYTITNLDFENQDQPQWL